RCYFLLPAIHETACCGRVECNSDAGLFFAGLLRPNFKGLTEVDGYVSQNAPNAIPSRKLRREALERPIG
ncbi:hypothetical protein, partial [Escherichia coli]|uniref:hypothetical protein n=1 Tax=Escherichia coli TaxID=562 RepID=UPI0019539E97